MTHTLQHAVGEACYCDMEDIHECVICGLWLKLDRVHVDTCSRRCFKALLREQRKAL